MQTLENRFLLTLPVILSPAADTYVGREGETLVIPFEVATPLQENTLQFSYEVQSLPEGAELQVDPNTTQRRLVWWPDFDQAGDHPLTFVTTDELGNTSSRDVTIRIADRTDGTPGIRVTEQTGFNQFALRPATEEEWLNPVHGANLRIDAFDPENPGSGEVSLRIEGLPEKASQLGHWSSDTGTNARINWRPTIADVGTHTANVIATDSQGNQTTVPITIVVRANAISRTIYNFFPHVFSETKEAFYNRDAAIKHAVVEGVISIGAVATNETGQAWTEGNDPNDTPPSHARFRLVLLDSQGNETSIGGVIQEDEKVSLDTTTLPDGQYVVAVDLLEGDLDLWHPWSLVLTVDNDGSPETGPQKLAVVGTRGTYANWNLPGGKFGVDWVTVDGPSQNPSQPYPAKIIAPPADANARDALIPVSSWVSESLTKTYSYREEVDRFLAATPGGHAFVSGKMVKGEKFAEARVVSSLTTAVKYVGFDGPRNNNQVSDSSHYTPDPNSTGFIGVEASGRVFRVDRDGTVTTLFGPRRKSDVIPYQVEDNVSDAALRSQQEEFIGQYDVALSNPWDLVFDPLDSNILFIADLNNHRIAKLDFGQPIPTLSTFTGTIGVAGFTDGATEVATFNGPISVTADPNSGVLYVSDRHNHAIRRVERDGTVSTVVGQGPDSVPDRVTLNQNIQDAGGKEAFLLESAPFASAVLYYPYALRVDSQGDLFVSEGVISSIRRIDFTTQTVEKVRILFERGVADSWFDVDRRGNVGPIDDLIVSEHFVGDRFMRLSSDGSRYESFSHALFIRPGEPAGTYNSGFGAAGSHPLSWSTVIDDESAAIGIASRHRTSFTLLRPIQAGDVSTSEIDTGAFANGLVVAASGTAASLPFDLRTPGTGTKNAGVIAMSLRPSLFNLYGASGHAFVGELGTYDDLAKMSDGDLANFIRSGAGGSVARPEITGVDLRDLIYHIRSLSLQGRSQLPDLNAIDSNLETIGLHDTGDTRPVEIRDVKVTPLSDTVVRINWVTDESAIGFVQYGTTERLGQFSAIEDGFAKQHEVVLRNLLPDREYHLRVRQKDLAGNTLISGDIAFELGNPDTQPPTVPENLQISGLTATTFNLTWKAATDAVELGGYRLDVSKNNTFTTFVSGYQDRSVGDTTSYTVTGLVPEIGYFARLRAVDAAGNASGHSIVVATRLPMAPPNTAPIVEVGSDQSTTILDAVSLNATVTDDGLPVPASLSYAWTVSSGPGTVKFNDATAVDTSATFSKTGQYTLRLEASDGEFRTTDALQVTVNDPPGGGLLARWRFDGNAKDSARNNHATNNEGTFVDGRYDQAISFDGESSVVKIGDPSGVLAPSQITIAGWVKPTQASNSYVIARGAGSVLSYQLRTTASHRFLTQLRNKDGQTSPSIYFGVLSPHVWTHLAVTWDGATIKTYQDGALQSETMFAGSGVNPSSRPLYVGANAYAVPSYSGAVDDLRFYATALDEEAVNAIAQNPVATVDAGADQRIEIGETLSFRATVSYDTAPSSPVTLSYQWQKISGPGDVGFANASSKDTTATFPTIGDYVVEVTATDGDFTSRDRVTITVDAVEPLGHWRFDGDVQDSIGSHHGIAQGVTFTAGQHDQAVSFDGSNSSVKLSDTTNPLTPSQITIAGWIKPAEAANSYVLARGVGSVLSYQLRTTSRNRFLTRLRSSDGKNSPYVYFGEFSTDRWTHIALTWDGETIKTYQDGTLQTETRFVGSGINPSSRPLYVGANAWGVPSYSGAVDDLRFYASALDTDSIASLATPPSQGEVAALSQPVRRPQRITPSITEQTITKTGADSEISNLHSDAVDVVLGAVSIGENQDAWAKRLQDEAWLWSWQGKDETNGSQEIENALDSLIRSRVS